MEIHSRKMTLAPGVNFEELARSTDEFNGAQLKAVCVEAGMIALREGATKLNHEHYLSGIAEGEILYRLMVSFRGLRLTIVVDSAKQEEERSHVLRMIVLFYYLSTLIICFSRNAALSCMDGF